MNVTEVRRCEMKWSSEPNFQNCFSIVCKACVAAKFSCKHRLVWKCHVGRADRWHREHHFSVAVKCQVQVNSAGHANVF